MSSRAVFLGMICGVLALMSAAPAALITVNDFGSSAVVENFSSLSDGSLATPLTLGGATYSTDAANFQVEPIIGLTEKSLLAYPQPGNKYIDVAFASPVEKAGLWVGSTQTYGASVSFFDIDDDLLGSANVGAAGGDLRFAGWQAEDEPIARIRAVVTAATSATRVTNVISEVPEPTSAAALLLGTAVFLTHRARFN